MNTNTAAVEALLITPEGETPEQKRARFAKIASERRWAQARNDKQREARWLASIDRNGLGTSF